jgi:4-carboxymuconolactone decarboxylase
MKPENQERIAALLRHSDTIGDDITADITDILGSQPFILEYLRRRPEAFLLSTLGDLYTCRPESLDARTAELVTIAAAAASDAADCLKVHIRAAKLAGASDDEILDVILISSLVGKTRLLASALRIYAAETDKREGATR